jgi:hypothetical protein
MKDSFKKLLKELDRLNLPKDSYVIFGSGPMAVRGLKDTHDLDVLVTKKLFSKLREKFKQDTSKHPCGCLVIGNIEIGDKWQGESKKVLDYINDPDIIEGYPFVKLEYVLEWKESSDRQKDRKQVQIIKEYLNNN